jgi:hypothetical protein
MPPALQLLSAVLSSVLRPLPSALCPLLSVLCPLSAFAASPYEPIQALPVQPLYSGQPEKVERGWKWGGINWQQGATVSAMYDDNIFLGRQGHEKSDLIWGFSPELLAIAGRTIDSGPSALVIREPGASTLSAWEIQPESGGRLLALQYRPSFYFFTDRSDQNSVDHEALLKGIWLSPAGKLRLELMQDFQQLTEPVVETGSRVQRRYFHTYLNSRYEFTDKTSLEMNVRQTLLDYQSALQLSGYKEWRNINWFNYRIASKTSLGIGLTMGLMESDASPNQTYERLQARVTYLLADKITLSLSTGAELRQLNSALADRFDPVFTAGLAYRPTEKLFVGLYANRDSVASSTSRNENFVITSFSASVRQQVWHKFFAGFTFGYYLLDSYPTSPGAFTERQDNYWQAGPTFESRLSARWSASLFYRYRQNDSNTGYTYGNNQAGIQLSWQL